MRIAVAALAAAGCLALARPACDMKTTEKRDWCPKCDKVFPRSTEKVRKCPEDKADTAQVELCVKQKYVARCHPDKQGPAPVKCCGVTYDKPTADEKAVFHVCQGCKAKHRQATKVEHAADCSDKRVKKACEHP
jgi:hypothetical protein